MHELTASEAATILSILSKDGGTESSDIGPTGIPASTFYATRRKIYEAGWLSDRYVPHPWGIGIRAIDCTLVRPGPAERVRVERDLASSAENVVLWSGLNVLLSISFRQKGEARKIENGTTVSITADSGSVPVYFDYSRSWSRFIRVERETGYPRSFGEVPSRAERPVPSAVPGLILQDQNGGDSDPPTRRWHSSAGLSRIEQRLLERGILRSRTFLSPDAVPPYDGRALGEIVFLTGRLREGVSSADVLSGLDGQCHVSPILLADDGTNVLILALGQVGAGASVRTKVPRAAGPVAATLDSHLKDLQMIVEHVDSLRKLVDHRYDRLFPRPRSAGTVPTPGITE
ncbi:MAG TPA: hypothetical protein VMH38_01300 [Thermoplasmata archaeon]|nr:hypothetical protein [Thermoplasmata archaeon]